MTNRLRLAAILLAALPLAGCGNKGPLTLAPQPAGPPPSPADVASDAIAPMASVVAPAAATVSPPAYPTQSSETIVPPSASTVAPPPADESDDGSGTPR